MPSASGAGLPEYSFRTSSDKSLPSHRISLMRVSPRMDLLLLAADNGDVLLFRWGWERVWLVSRPKDLPAAPRASESDGDCPPLPLVTCIDWRPDGQVAFVAYSDGRLRHLSLEDGAVLHEDHVTRPGDCSDEDEGAALCSHWALLANRQFNEPWTRAADALPVFADVLGAGSTAGGGANVDWTSLRRIERQLSLLALATRRRVHLLAYGICRLCRVSLDQLSDGVWNCAAYRPTSVALSDSLASLSVLGRAAAGSGDSAPLLLQCDTGLAGGAARYERVRRVALTVVQLTQLSAAVRRCLKDMRECWEDSVHELDQKFADYSKDRDEYALAMGEPEWRLRTDLMALLMTGHCHSKFREFLCEGLSRAGLVRIGRGIEDSLCSVQRHNARQLQALLFAAIFHLGELADLSATGLGDFGSDCRDAGVAGAAAEAEDEENSDELAGDGGGGGFDSVRDLGGDEPGSEDGEDQLGELSRRRAVEALTYAGSALAKSLELGAVIERTRESLRAFCEWLYVQILRLSKEAVPRSLQRSTAQRRKLIIEFIRRQLADGADPGQRRFRLELVGQYLADSALAAQPDCSTVWQRLLERHLGGAGAAPTMRQRRLTLACLLVQPDKEASLAQCLARLCDKVAAACQLAEPTRLALLSPAMQMPGLRPLAQGHMGGQGQYHALLLHADKASCLLVRRDGTAAAGWRGLRFRCSSLNGADAEFTDACQLDASQFACLLAAGEEPGSEASPSTLAVLPLNAFNDADWTALGSQPAAAVDLQSAVDLAERLGDRLRADNLPGRGVAVAAERRLLVSVLFSCRRRLRACLLEPHDGDEDEDDEVGEDNAMEAADREEEHQAAVSMEQD